MLSLTFSATTVHYATCLTLSATGTHELNVARDCWRISRLTLGFSGLVETFAATPLSVCRLRYRHGRHAAEVA